MIPITIIIFTLWQIVNSEHYTNICLNELNITPSTLSSHDQRCLYACEYAKAFPYANTSPSNYTNMDLGYLTNSCEAETKNIVDICQRGNSLLDCSARKDQEISEKCKIDTNTADLNAPVEELGCYLRCIFIERNWIDEYNIWKQFAAKISEDKLKDCYADNNQLDLCVQFGKRYKCIADAKLALYIDNLST